MKLSLAALAAYFAAAAFFTWPLVAHPFSLLAVPAGPGDAFLNLWILGWDLETISTNPVALLNGSVFDANIFHPARQTLAFSDHLILQALMVWPAYAATGNAAFCANLLLFGSLVAAAFAMYVFAHAVTGSRWGAFIAGLVWGFWPYHFAHLIHPQLQSLYFLPLTFLFLHRLMAAGRRRDALGLGIMAALQAVSSVYYAVIGAVGLIVAAIVLAIAVGRWRSALLVRRLSLAAVVGLALILPMVWVYFQVQEREGLGRNLFEAARHSATPASYFSVPPTNVLYGMTGILPSSTGHEGQLFAGLTILVLAVAGYATARRRDAKPLALAMAAVVGVGFLLSLGPEGGVRGIYATLHRFVFGFQAVRAPARFGVLVAFGLAVLAALGVKEIVGRFGQRERSAAIWLPALLALLVSVEFANALDYVHAPPSRTALGQWLREAPESGPVVYLPLGADLDNTPFMVNSLEHRRPIVNGYSGNRPDIYNIVSETIRGFPSPDALWTLHELDVRFIVSPQPIDSEVWPVVERARFPAVREAFLSDSIVYELRWSDDAEARFAAPPPPDPGPMPFAAGETAVYTVSWAGAAGNLAAGQATLTALRYDAASNTDTTPADASAAQFRFTVEATTADWISRFFEARDTFETLADGTLRPIVHTRHLREGRKVVDLTVEYDHVALTARRSLGASAAPSEMSLRIPPGVRDSVTALYYARSLRLNPGSRVRVPVNDAGRNLILEINAIREEDIDHAGQRVRALRLEPRLIASEERRRPVQIVLWLSVDARRVPLVVEVSAPFGKVRANLTSYRER